MHWGVQFNPDIEIYPCWCNAVFDWLIETEEILTKCWTICKITCVFRLFENLNICLWNSIHFEDIYSITVKQNSPFLRCGIVILTENRPKSMAWWNTRACCRPILNRIIVGKWGVFLIINTLFVRKNFLKIIE